MRRYAVAVVSTAVLVGVTAVAVAVSSSAASPVESATSIPVSSPPVGTVPPSPSATGGTIDNCPSGYVCLYSDPGWSTNTVEHMWKAYGYHALTDEYGTHWILNNQYATSAGRPGAFACTSTTASSCTVSVPMGQWRRLDITPVNEVRLTSSGG